MEAVVLQGLGSEDPPRPKEDDTGAALKKWGAGDRQGRALWAEPEGGVCLAVEEQQEAGGGGGSPASPRAVDCVPGVKNGCSSVSLWHYFLCQD